MIVITTDEFRPAVEPLLEWKNRKGIKTDLYIYPTDTGAGAAAVKSFIQAIYDSEDGLAFILIVGDADDVPPARGYSANAGGMASDPVYTLLAGDDEYADAMIGRFSVATLTQAETVVNKNLWYEMNPDPNGGWYHKAVGLAGDDRYFTPHPREIMEEIREMMLGYHYTEFTTIYDPEARKSHIFDAVNEGRGWINVHFHGTEGGWVRWQGAIVPLFNGLDVQQLENAYMTPIVISCSCSNGAFDNPGRNSFAEAWQRHGTPREPKGSIVFLGASSALWHYAWVVLKEINYHLVNENYFTAGGLVFNGMMKMIEMFPHEPRYEGLETFQLFHLFGDPSLFIYSDTPGQMEIAYNKSLHPGAGFFTVHVSHGGGPVKNALAALYMNGKLYGSAYTGEAGTVAIPIQGGLPGSGTMEVNVTAYNKMPYFGTVKIKASRTGKKIEHRQ